MPDQPAWDVAERAANVLAPESDLFADVDMAGFGQALTAAAAGCGSGAACGRGVAPGGRVGAGPMGRGCRGGSGSSAEPPVRGGSPRTGGSPIRRGVSNPLFYGTRQSYLLTAPVRRRRARRGSRGRGDGGQGSVGGRSSCSTRWRRRTSCRRNPAALKRAFDTGGASLVGARGISSTTCCNNQGRPRQVDTSGFEIGREPGRDAGQGGLPQRADGADPVRAADRAGARRRRCCAARRGSTSTT